MAGLVGACLVGVIIIACGVEYCFGIIGDSSLCGYVQLHELDKATRRRLIEREFSLVQTRRAFLRYEGPEL